MDTTGFFQYPGSQDLTDVQPGFLEERGEDDWALLLDHTETRRFRAGQAVLTQGEHDRALYMLVDGWLHAPSGDVHPISTFGEAAFLDGRPRAVSVTAIERRRGPAAQPRGLPEPLRAPPGPGPRRPARPGPHPRRPPA